MSINPIPEKKDIDRPSPARWLENPCVESIRSPEDREIDALESISRIIRPLPIQAKRRIAAFLVSRVESETADNIQMMFDKGLFENGRRVVQLPDGRVASFDPVYPAMRAEVPR
jgi:hypothetical protein